MDTWLITPSLYQGAGCPGDDHTYDLAIHLCSWEDSIYGCKLTTSPKNSYWPIPDGSMEQIDINELEALVSNLCDVVLDGRKVLVHCAAGINRSSLVTALVVRRLFGLSGVDATAYIRARRGPEALSNPDFATYLASLGPCEALRRP